MRRQPRIRQWPTSRFARSSATPGEQPGPERRAAARRWLQLAFTVFLAAIAIVYLIALRSYSFGGASDPGPALFPVVVFGLLLLCSLIGIVVLLRGRETEPPADGEEALVAQAAPEREDPAAAVAGAEAAPRSSAMRMLAVIVIAVIYCVLLPTVGDLVTGFVLCGVVATAARSRSWMLTLAAAVVLALGVHELFVSVLAVPLPTGPWSI